MSVTLLQHYTHSRHVLSMSRTCKKCYDKNVLIECACGCGRIINAVDKWNRRTRYKKGHAIGSGINNLNWKGGRTKAGRGYVLAYRPDHPHAVNCYVKEHRLVYEQHYNCCLLPWIDIHHKDGNKQNNTWSNLQPLTHSQHSRLENIKDMSNRICSICRSDKTALRVSGWGIGRPLWIHIEGQWACHNCYQKNRYRKKNEKEPIR